MLQLANLAHVLVAQVHNMRALAVVEARPLCIYLLHLAIQTSQPMNAAPSVALQHMCGDDCGGGGGGGLLQAAILHSLSQRFEMGQIYTFTANAILLAVNPFKVCEVTSRISKIFTRHVHKSCSRCKRARPSHLLAF